MAAASERVIHYVADEGIASRAFNWRVLDEPSLRRDVEANLTLASALLQGYTPSLQATRAAARGQVVGPPPPTDYDDAPQQQQQRRSSSRAVSRRDDDDDEDTPPPYDAADTAAAARAVVDELAVHHHHRRGAVAPLIVTRHEPPYDASRYRPSAATLAEKENRKLRARISALETTRRADEKQRIAALEREVAAMRATMTTTAAAARPSSSSSRRSGKAGASPPPAWDDDDEESSSSSPDDDDDGARRRSSSGVDANDDLSSMAPTYESSDEEAPRPLLSPAAALRKQQKKKKKSAEGEDCTSLLYVDAARRAAKQRSQYRRERAVKRSEEAEVELRELASKRRALSAPGPFNGLMKRESQMAQRKREALLKAQLERDQEFTQHRFVVAKEQQAHVPFTNKSESARRKEGARRAAAHLADADAKAPRVSLQSTEAFEAKRKKPVVFKKQAWAPSYNIKPTKEETKIKLDTARRRWDDFVDFQRRGKKQGKEVDDDEYYTDGDGPLQETVEAGLATTASPAEDHAAPSPGYSPSPGSLPSS